jgi:gamma-glutamylaminecyclotransferase
MAVLLFVYGTLLRGEANHPVLSDAAFVRSACTEARYELVDLGGYPALLEDGDTAVSGEVYDVNSALLAQLDRFEEVPELYERKPVALIDGQIEAYVMSRDRAGGAPRIEDGDWRAVARSDAAKSGG